MFMNKKVFSNCLNAHREVAWRMVTGSLFHIFVAMKPNLPSANLIRVRPSCSLDVSDEDRSFLVGSVVVRSRDRYDGQPVVIA